MTMSRKLREEIKRSGKSLYRISKESGVSAATLTRFMASGEAHRDIRLEGTADRLAAYLGLELAPKRKPKK